MSDTARHEMMAKKLMAEVSAGRIDNEWAEEFICSVHNRLDAGLSLSDKQSTKLEELFERY